MTRRRPRNPSRLPRLSFRDGGPRLTARQLSEFAFLLDLPPELKRFLIWRNGGTPENRWFSWDHPAEGVVTSRVDRFLGVDPGGFDGPREPDMIWAILRFRSWLPRWSIPIALVDEDSFLVTFTLGDRADQVWYKQWCHDAPDVHADPERDCFFIAASAPAFVLTLRAEDAVERPGASVTRARNPS